MTKTAARLLSALTALAGAAASLPRPTRVDLPSADELELEPVMLPRDAFFAAKETVSADNAIGRIAAEQITPYPPGIPVIVPGERITAKPLEYLRSGLAAGMQLPDPGPQPADHASRRPHLILATAPPTAADGSLLRRPGRLRRQSSPAGAAQPSQ